MSGDEDPSLTVPLPLTAEKDHQGKRKRERGVVELDCIDGGREVTTVKYRIYSPGLNWPENRTRVTMASPTLQIHSNQTTTRSIHLPLMFFSTTSIEQIRLSCYSLVCALFARRRFGYFSFIDVFNKRKEIKLTTCVRLTSG